MSVSPFGSRKPALDRSDQRRPKDKLILGRNKILQIPDPRDDDFQKEIDFTRASEPLMKLLRLRAKQRATISLREIKKRLQQE
jgi:hypothetical protein